MGTSLGKAGQVFREGWVNHQRILGKSLVKVGHLQERLGKFSVNIREILKEGWANLGEDWVNI